MVNVLEWGRNHSRRNTLSRSSFPPKAEKEVHPPALLPPPGPLALKVENLTEALLN